MPPRRRSRSRCPALLAAARHRAPLVFEVRDLWPEAPIQMGALRNPLAQRLARALERFVYRRSARVIALSPGIRDGVAAAGVARPRIVLVPNASDLELFSPALDRDAERARLGLGNGFVCSYFGTLGEANDLSQVVRAAPLVDGVTFVLLGDGKQRAELEREARASARATWCSWTRRPTRRRWPGWPRRRTPASRSSRTCPCWPPTRPTSCSTPSRPGRPAIVNQPGWMRELVERNEAGLFVRPGDPGDLAEKVAWLRDHPDEAERFGRNARALAEREFDRDELAARVLAVLEEAAG